MKEYRIGTSSFYLKEEVDLRIEKLKDRSDSLHEQLLKTEEFIEASQLHISRNREKLHELYARRNEIQFLYLSEYLKAKETKNENITS